MMINSLELIGQNKMVFADEQKLRQHDAEVREKLIAIVRLLDVVGIEPEDDTLDSLLAALGDGVRVLRSAAWLE
jgi:hypothetical protein